MKVLHWSKLDDSIKYEEFKIQTEGKLRSGDSCVRDILYQHYCFKKGLVAECGSQTSEKLPGFLSHYWSKLERVFLPQLRERYPDFKGEWLFDVAGNHKKTGFDQYIFVPPISVIREIVDQSFPHLKNPAMSQKVLLNSVIELLSAQHWYLGEHVDSPELEGIADAKKRKIETTRKSLLPLNRRLGNTYIQDRILKKNKMNIENPEKFRNICLV